MEGESDTDERFGIHTDKYYSCQQCNAEHSGCLVKDMENYRNECYDAYIEYCHRAVT